MAFDTVNSVSKEYGIISSATGRGGQLYNVDDNEVTYSFVLDAANYADYAQNGTLVNLTIPAGYKIEECVVDVTTAFVGLTATTGVVTIGVDGSTGTNGIPLTEPNLTSTGVFVVDDSAMQGTFADKLSANSPLDVETSAGSDPTAGVAKILIRAINLGA